MLGSNFKCRHVLLALGVCACSVHSVTAQVSPSSGDNVDVTSDSSTWIQPVTGNGVDIPTGANGVTINNGVGGMILGNPDAIRTAAETTINNQGNIAGAVNGVNFVNGLGSGTLNNVAPGVISSDSRAVNIGGSVELTNSGSILGTGNQRNGTVYSDVSGNNFSVSNSGLIDAGAGNLGAGFSAELSGTGTNFTLENSGDIVGRGNAGAGLATAGDGIRLERTRTAGSLANTTTGLFNGSISNSGNVTSEGANGTVGAFRAVNGVSFQGTLTNEVGGVFAGQQNGVYFGNPTPSGGGDHTGGVVNNLGLISSDSRAFNVDGTGLTVNNSGTILATGVQRNGTFYADSTAQGFTLNNRTSGVIDAGEGLEGAAFSAELSQAGNNFTINNSGQLLGRGNAGAGLTAAGDGIRFERERVGGALDGTTSGLFTGNVTNTGTISSEGANGTVAGLRFVNGTSFQGEINNQGVLKGEQNGLYFGNATPAGGGEHTGIVNNSGTISSGSRAVNIDGSGLVLNNSGNILATGSQRNGTVYADSTAQGFTLNNEASGVIDAGEGLEGAAFSVELSQAGNNFSINNRGQLLGRGNAGAGLTTAGDGIRFERERVGGALDGTTSGLFTGSVSNTGTISSEGANGTVAGLRFVNGTSFQGEINNQGILKGEQNGLYFGNATPAGGGEHTGVVNNSGTISSGSRAVNIDGSGLELNNTGSILATGSQRNGTVYADSTAQDFTLNNQGLIDAGAGLEGAAFSVELAATGNTFSINNSGNIVGRGNASAGAASAGDGLRFERSRVDGSLLNPSTGLFDGVINNSGSITSEGANGTVAGVRFVNGTSFQGTLNNRGTIAGTQNGVYFGNPTAGGGGDHTGGVVNNSGRISSDSRAFNLDGIGLTVNNSGEILATGRQRNGTFYLDGTATDFSVTNLASGSIDARGGAGSGVSFQVGVADGAISTQTGSIVNAGFIAGSGDATNAAGDSIDAGIRLFAPEHGDTFRGDIINQVGGVITADEAPAVLVETGVLFDGTLFNNGTIDGGVSLASGDVVLGETSSLILGISGDNEFDTFDVLNGDLTLDGTLELSFLESFAPEVGDVFDLFDFNNAVGSFDQIIANGVLFDTSDLFVNGNVTVAAVGVPEPSAWLLVSLGGLVLTSRRRRKI